MCIQFFTQKILQELLSHAQYIQDDDFIKIVHDIRNARHIFLSGAGRSGICIQAFANRLMHLGFSVSLVGDVTSPHTQKGDLLIIASGSGETTSLVALVKKAKGIGIPIATMTMDKDSTIAQLSETVIVLPGVSPKLQHSQNCMSSIQPMGSAFEQLCFIIYDAIILELMKQLNLTSERMFQNHADLE